MNVADISTLIGSFGFPIVACICMGWFVNTTMKEYTKTLQEHTVVLAELKEFIKSIHDQ